MMYRLRIPKGVQREIERLPSHIRLRIQRMIAGLTIEPRPENASELEEELAGLWRIKLENLRTPVSARPGADKA